MEIDDLTFRVRRIYAALGAVEITDMSKFVPQLINNGQRKGFSQNFRGGLSDEELVNFVYSLIENIANLRNVLNEWAESNKQDKTKVKDAFNKSEALKIIMDLYNIEKHIKPQRNRGYSGKSPKIINIDSVMQLSAGDQNGSCAIMTVTPQGIPQISGPGSGKVIITGDIVDKENKKVGDFHQIAVEAIEIWERVLADFGVKL